MGALALAVGMVGPIACGGQESDEQQIRATVEKLQQAFSDRKTGELCAALTPAARRQVAALGHKSSQGPGSCASKFPMIEPDLRERRAGTKSWPTVSAITIKGEHATASLTIAGGERMRLPFAKDGGEWKVDALFGDVPAGRQEDKF